VRDLGQDEVGCFREILYEETQKKKGRHPIISGNHLIEPFQLEDGSWPHPVNSFLQSEAMNKIWSSKLDGFGKAGGSGNKSAAKGDTADAVVVEVEVPKEKTSWNLTLRSFDSTKKIAAIKEVKALFGFGLKDAKEMVEKAPCVLREGVNAEEGKVFMEKLVKAGCVVEMV